MATTNKRVLRAQEVVINGVNAGGLMQARIQSGYEDIIQTPADGLAIPLIDRATQFVRGTITTQDWVEFINLLTGTSGTLVFHERKSGTAEASGYIKHTITNPVIYRARLNIQHRKYATVSFDFECKAADPTKTIADMWTPTDSQNAPTYVAAVRAIEIKAAVHGGTLNIYHVTGFDFAIEIPLSKASQDGDVGYTAVDAIMGGVAPSGSITYQDSGIASSKLTAQSLALAAAGNLVLTVAAAQGGADQTVTIANVIFGSAESDASSDNNYTTFTSPLMVTNNASTPLTLAGVNKIITIA